MIYEQFFITLYPFNSFTFFQLLLPGTSFCVLNAEGMHGVSCLVPLPQIKNVYGTTIIRIGTQECSLEKLVFVLNSSWVILSNHRQPLL